VMAVMDVGLNYVSSYVADGAEKLSRTPKMSLSKMFTQPRMLAKEFVGTSAFKQLKCFGDAHGRGQADKHVDVVWFNLKFVNFHILRFSNYTLANY